MFPSNCNLKKIYNINDFLKYDANISSHLFIYGSEFGLWEFLNQLF